MNLKHTHSDRLERWLGPAAVARITDNMRHWYGPPIALHGVPGAVYAARGGDFVGEIRGGQEMSAVDRAVESLKRHERAMRLRSAHARRQSGAFGSLSALIAAATGGKAQNLTFSKTGVASNAIGNANDLWTRAGLPAAGSAGAAAPGGTATTSSTTGNWLYKNPANANTGHFVTGYCTASVINNTLLIIDQLLRVAKTMNSTSTEAVTGTFSRYQNQTAATDDYIGGNFCFPSNPTTVLAATAHNWTVCQYCVDEATECLTKRLGWTSFRDLRDDDEIMAFDPVTQTTRWERIKGKFVNEHYRGDMISMGEREFSAFTTPDHRWPVRRDYDGMIEVQRSESLKQTGDLLRYAPHEGCKESLSDAFIEICAWYFTEGSVHGEHSIRIAQSHLVNPRYVAEIRDALGRLGATTKTKADQGDLLRGQPRGTRCRGLYFSEHISDNGMVETTLSGTEIDAIRSAIAGPDKVPTMEFLSALSTRQARLFVEVCQKGDGTPSRRLFFQHHERRMDAYMVASVLAGAGPNLFNSGEDEMAGCSLRQAHTNISKLPRTRLYYEGPIWCPITESGHWVSRRYGKTCITGNTDQDGNTAQSFPSIAGVSAGVVGGIDLAVGGPAWFMPLASGDVGVKALTQMQCSAAVATGTIDFVVAHPIAYMPCPIANIVCVVDGVNTAFNLTKVYDNACLSAIEMPKPATTATNYSGQLTLVAE